MQDCKSIVETLRSEEDSGAIREAAFLAGEEQCLEAVPVLAGMLSSGNLGVQEAADHALRKIGGKATVQAVIPLLRSDDAPARNLAMDILREVGNQDMQSLVALMHDDDADIRIFVSDILGSTDSVTAVQPLGEALLKDPEVNVRYQAAVSLGELGRPESAKYLNQALGDEEWVQFSVIEALSKIRDESSVSALAKAMAHSSDLVASMIVEALGEMGNVKAVTMLLKQLDASPTALRNKIVKAVVQILGGKSLTMLSEAEREKFRQYLLVALHDEDTDIQDAAILGLGHVGGEKASEEVLKIAADLDPDMDHDRLTRCVDSLAGIGLTKALEKGLDQGSYKTARVVVEALSRLNAPEVSAVLTGAFWDKERDLQRDIVAALQECAGEEARGFFLDVLERHNDGSVLKAALGFLGGLGDEALGERLCAFLEHPYDDVKEAALEACVSVGGADMNRRFQELYSSPDAVLRLMAVYAMGKLGVAEHMEYIKEALEDEIPDIRKVALEALADVCGGVEDWLPLIQARLTDENREVRLTVVELMGQCPGDDVIPSLLQVLKDPDDWVKVRAVEALGARQSPESAPALVELLSSDSTLLALKAVDALGEIGGRVAFRALLDVLNAERSELQEAAEEAIARLQEREGGAQ
ncbi:HEAT repeat domain-containing protein [Desulfocurvus sp. DL9XJH121]